MLSQTVYDMWLCRFCFSPRIFLLAATTKRPSANFSLAQNLTWNESKGKREAERRKKPWQTNENKRDFPTASMQTNDG